MALLLRKDSSQPEPYLAVARWLAVLAAAIGLVVLAGWALRIEVLKSILPIWVSMKSVTALLFVLSGGGLLLALDRGRRPATGIAARAAGVVVALIGALALVEYVLRVDLGLDQLLFHEAPGTVGTVFPGRISVTAAVDFVLIGWTVFFFRTGGTWRVQAPALLAGGIALLSITGYLYDEATLQQIGPQFIAVHTAIAFVLLAAGIVVGHPGSALVRLLKSSGPDGVLTRRLFPAVMVVPLVLGWALFAGARFGLYSVTTGWALFAMTTGVSLAFFTGWSASSVEKSDRSFRDTMATLRAVLESVEMPVFSVDRDLRYTNFNRAHADGMRDAYGARIAIGGSILDYQTMEADRAPARLCLERALGGEKVIEARGSGESGTQPRFFEITYNPITGRAGDVIGVSVFAHDITGHVQEEELIRRANVSLEKSLLHEKNLLETVINSLPDLVFVKNRDSQFVLVNRALADWAGAGSTNDLVGRSDSDFLPAAIAEKYLVDDRRILDTGESVINMEEPFALSSGQDRWILTTKVPLRDESGEISGIVGISRDITDRKELATRLQQAQKLESLGVLAGGIAHDFNNILTVIMGNAEVALKGIGPGSTARKHVSEITKASQRAAELCRQMLAYSGQGRQEVKPMDLSEVIDEMQEMLRMAVSTKAALRLQLERRLPAVDADVAQVRQIVMNLVINASEATGEAGGAITVVTAAIECDRAYLDSEWSGEPLPEGRYVLLQVEDQGSGMDAETRRRIFEPFFTTKFAGRGLGLAAVIGIVRGHGGAIRVSSEQGKGSTFKILFPASASPLQPSAAAEVSTGELHGRGTVLLVDDEQGIRMVGRAMLEALGFSVLEATDGAEAVATYRARAREIACVLLDLTMPNMGGEETFRKLRLENPDVRVLICSGYSAQQVERQFPDGATAGFLQKPYTFSALETLLKEVLAP